MANARYILFAGNDLGGGDAASAPPSPGFSKIAEGTFTVASGMVGENIAIPGSPQEDDLVLAVVACNAAIAFPTVLQGGGFDLTSSGFTRIPSVSGTAPGYDIIYKVMGPTPDTVIPTFQFDGRVSAGLIQIWRGADIVTPIDNTAVRTTGASGDPDPGSFDTVTAGALRIIVGLLDDDDSAASMAAPLGYTDMLAKDTGQASTTVGATVVIASKVAETAGAEDPGAFTCAGDDAWAAFHFALRPA